jgi:hypothetical protein
MKNISESEFKRKIEIEIEKEIENVLKNEIGEFKNILKFRIQKRNRKMENTFPKSKKRIEIEKKEKTILENISEILKTKISALSNLK